LKGHFLGVPSRALDRAFAPHAPAFGRKPLKTYTECG
jgi:hypothetical protein